MYTVNFDNRPSGIKLVGDLPWGSHFCQFYQTENDLFDILAPYFKAGLENNELCLWITSRPLRTQAARDALKKAIPLFDDYVAKGQIEIIARSRRHTGKDIVSRLDRAVYSGFDGLRLACQASGGKISGAAPVIPGELDFSRFNIIAVSAYPREKFDAVGLMEVVKHHCFALVRNAGRWEVIESSEATVARDALKRSQEKLHSLFSNMSEGFAYHRIVLDHEGKPCDYIFLELNESFEKLTGLNAKAVIGRRATEVLPGLENDPTDWIGRFGSVALSGQPVQFESYAKGLEKWYSVSAFSPHKGFFAVTFSDVTEKKAYENALQVHASRLEAANRELESFSYSVSHDLRAPLRAIVGFARKILDEKGPSFDAETRRRFGIIQDNAARMGMLIDDLLRLSRLSRADLKRSDFDLGELVWEVLDEIRFAEPERQFSVEISEFPSICADRAMVRQLLTNLLSNAVKFTRTRPEAHIEVGWFARSGERVFYIKDNGVGFNMKYYNKLFGVFQRLVGESEFEGTGVGLAIVERIVRRHGGRVWAEGQDKEGAVFYFTLPSKEQE